MHPTKGHSSEFEPNLLDGQSTVYIIIVLHITCIIIASVDFSQLWSWYAVDIQQEPITWDIQQSTPLSVLLSCLIEQRTLLCLLPSFLYPICSCNHLVLPPPLVLLLQSVSHVFHNLRISLARCWCFFTFSRTFSSILLSPGAAILIIQVWCISLFLTMISCLRAWMTWFVQIAKTHSTFHFLLLSLLYMHTNF